MLAPDRAVIRSIEARLVMGMMPGTMGTVMPGRAGAGDELEVAAVVEEQLGDEHVDARRAP